ncbi:hypothetical protein PILCRDRAFT_812968 [Piloderma croceum F 1598]|uniref:U4/U6 snRNA-associated-splicing factor PRP24 n=1 Tax=Piloderma croceum (strain F 1598) TaxID=765440 RepID=A0A0C3GEK5_PILCF|nr:hypothetical protein PILCRDRAFT_812968 [Piloderma croceum F 1598]
MDESRALDALATILSSLTLSPFDISLHAQHIRLAQSIQSFDPSHLSAAREMLTTHFPAGDEVWIPLIKEKEESVDLNQTEGILDTLELYSRAEVDYLSMVILQKHIDFLINRHAWFAALDNKPEGFGELFSTEWTRSVISVVVSKGAAHLTQSHTLWDLQRDWEFALLEAAPPSEKQAQVEIVDKLLLERLQQPHSSLEETFQIYSSFTTNHRAPQQYESLLVAASKLRGPAVKAYDRRAEFERSLAQAKFSLEAYAYYIANERAKKPDLFIVRGLYERAIAEAARRRFIGDVGAEEALRSFWGGYCDVLRIHRVHERVENETLRRAVRSVPSSGDVWARYLRFLERTADSQEPMGERESVSEAFGRAMSMNVLQKDVEQVVPIVLARASYEKRLLEDDKAEEDTWNNLIKTLEDGISAVRRASPTGDARLRLEKYLSELYVNLDFVEKAISVWQTTTKHYKTSYVAWMSYTDMLIRKDQYDDARSLFSDLAYKNLDWPEAIWEAWISFEHQHGSVAELEACLDKVERAQYQVNMRRAKEAEKAAYQTMQVAAEQQAATVPVKDAPIPSEADTSMVVDVRANGDGRGKRKAEESPSAETSKKARIEQPPPPLKRDRENCTVFVADLPSSTTEEDLTALFKDCGKVREVKFTQLRGALVATVEFFERDNVPAALTKDKKRLQGEEIAVHLAWKSTLYVTNFPESTDDGVMRELFGQYGLIFDVRWPSKKYKSTRRFCYVQYTSPSSAQKALELHGRELEPDRPMSVLISDPERKKERTDADANEKEIYVAGLSKFTTKEDLMKLFKTYGPVKDVRMASEQNGQSKGFAFIEFEEEGDAQAALGANNYELKKRRIAVTLADSRVRARNRNLTNETGLGRQAETRSRSIRIRNLPPATQEGLLQQALEKHALVKRVEVIQDSNEAVVELENPAEAGKLLLRTEPLLLNDTVLQISEEKSNGPSRSRPSAPPAKTGGLFVPRAAVSRPRAGLGHARKPGIAASTSTTSSQGRGQDDFRKMLAGGS